MNTPTRLTTPLTTWRQRLAARGLTTGPSDYADHLLADAEASEMEAIRARQAANRHIGYERRRPLRYAAAAYANLRTDQDPRGLIRTWWDHGPRVLILAGPARTGKTYAAYAVANHVHDQHKWVIGTTAADLSANLKPDADPTAYDHAVRCELLLIDDLGRERATEWWIEQLQRLVDARCGDLARLVITMNAEPDPAAVFDTLTSRYGNPIAERLIDGGGIVTMDGPAVREVITTW